MLLLLVMDRMDVGGVLGLPLPVSNDIMRWDHLYGLFRTAAKEGQETGRSCAICRYFNAKLYAFSLHSTVYCFYSKSSYRTYRKT